MSELHERLQRAVGDVYQIERELGGGGMSRLFLATEASLNRKVVIKLLAPELSGDVSLARFKREFELTATLQHPNILPVLGTGSRDGMLWYVTPYIAGESLRHRLQREARLPIADVARILHEASDALAFAHERGVIHRDIKPENILLLNGHAVLADFGIAAALAPGSTPSPDAAANPPNAARLTQVGVSMGTPGYMSPEQAAGEWNLDARADVYALGCVGYELLGGRPPFVGPTPRHVIAAHLSEPAKPIAALRADTPSGIAHAVMKALEKEPADRWQSAGEFRDALGMSFTGERSAYAPPRRGSRRAVAIALGAAAVAIAGGLFALRGRGGDALDENLVAVAPFEVLDPNLQVWREGLVDVLSANLDGMGPLRTVPPTTVIRRWDGRPDRETAAALGNKTGARLVLFGRVTRTGGDSARVSATLFDVGAGRALAELDASDESSRVDRLADSLTVRVLRELSQTRAIASVRRASLGSASLPAIKAYLQGEQHFRRSDFDSATAYYQKALEADSTFAPAMRKLATALAWTPGAGNGEASGRAYPLAMKAGTLNHGLAPRESILVVADSVSAAVFTAKPGTPRRPMATRLLAILDSATRRFPDDPEIWYRLGDARYHMTQMGLAKVPFASSRVAFDSSIALDSAFAPSYIHPVDLAFRAQDVDDARRYMRTYLALGANDTYASSFRSVLLLTDPKKPSGVDVDSLWKDNASLVSHVALPLMYYFDDGDVAVRLMKDAATSATQKLPPNTALQVRMAYAATLGVRGRMKELAAMPDSTLWYIHPEMAMVGAYPVDSVTAVARRQMADTNVNARVNSAMAWRVWADRRDTANLAAAVKSAETWPVAPGTLRLFPALARGYLALARGDSATALRELGTLPDTICTQYVACHMVRLTRAQMLYAAHRDREAAPILDIDFGYNGPMGVLWQLQKGQIAERLGDKAKAIDAYTFVANAFRKADPELQPVAEEARKGLRRLSADRGGSGG